MLTANFDRRLQFQKDWLRNEDFASPVANLFDFVLSEVNRLSRLSSSDLEESVNDVVYVEVSHLNLFKFNLIN